MHDGSSHPQEAGAVATRPAPRRRAARRSGLARRAVVHIRADGRREVGDQVTGPDHVVEQAQVKVLLAYHLRPATGQGVVVVGSALCDELVKRQGGAHLERLGVKARHPAHLVADVANVVHLAEAGRQPGMLPADGIGGQKVHAQVLAGGDPGAAVGRRQAGLGAAHQVVQAGPQVRAVADVEAAGVAAARPPPLVSGQAVHGEGLHHVERGKRPVVKQVHVKALLAQALGVALEPELDRARSRLVEPDPAGLSSQPPRNQSTTALRLRAMRVQNMVRARLNRHRLGRWADRLDPVVDLFDRGPKLRLSPRQAERVRELNRASNEALRLWLFPDRPDLFGPPPHREAEPRPGSRP